MSRLLNAYVIYGCMFAEKSTELIEFAHFLTSIGKRILVLKHSWDDRYDQTAIVTHRGEKFPAMSLSRLSAVPTEALESADTVLIDEGQFFPDLIDFAKQVDAMDKCLIVAGLDLTFQKKPFGQILELAAISVAHQQKVATCAQCGDVAMYTMRLKQKLPEGQKDEVVVVGGADLYQPACERCIDAQL